MGEQLEGELGELGDLLSAEDDVLDLGLDALDHPAPAAGLLLLVGHDFNVWKWLSSDSSQLTCQQQNIYVGAVGEGVHHHVLAHRKPRLKRRSIATRARRSS